jgi:hypothetical protein
LSKKSRDRRDRTFSESPFKVYRKKRLIELLDIDQSTWWRWRKEGRVPEPAFRHGRVEGWTHRQIEPLFESDDSDAS